MKKIFPIALALALAAALTLSTAVLADDPIELEEVDGATAEWTDEEAAVGDYSVRLDWPAPYWEEGNYIVPRASVAITDLPSDLTIGDVNSWSYWVNVSDVEAQYPGDGEDYCPNLTFCTDTTGSGDSDTTITAWPKPDVVDDWCLIDETTIGGYQGAYMVWGTNPWPSFKFDWAAVQSSYGSAEIIRFLMGKGVIGTNRDLTVYVDDLTINDLTYILEPPQPQPQDPYVRLEWASTNFLGTNAHVDWLIVDGEQTNILASTLEVTGICGGMTYTLVIPEGTEMNTCYFQVVLIDGELVFSNCQFSQPVTLTYDDETITFTRTLHGRIVE